VGSHNVSTLQGHHQALQEDRSKSCIMFHCIVGSQNVSTLQGHHQALQEDRSKICIMFHCIWDPTMQWNIIQLLDLSSWRVWWWPC